MPKEASWSPRAIAALAVAAVIAIGGAAWLLTAPSRPDRIAFVAEENATWDIWWVRGDGTGLARLTTTALDERAPSISPDRSQIAYSTSDGALHILNTSTRATTQLSLDPGRYSYPSWSPDGRQLVFTSYTLSAEGEDASLWVYDLASRKPRQLLKQDGSQDYGRYSPDGQTLLYSSSGAATVFGFGFSVIQQLWTLNMTTGRVEQLLLARGKDTQPAWSPDGRAIVFASERDGATQLWRVDASGAALKRLTTGANASTQPAWKPDGDEIVFVSGDGSSSGLALVAAAGGDTRPFIVDKRLRSVRDPHWR